MNLAQIGGQVGTGLIADKYAPHIPMSFSTFFSALIAFLLWGFSKSLGSLLTFAILYGLLAGGYSILYCRFATALTDERATGLSCTASLNFNEELEYLGWICQWTSHQARYSLMRYGINKYEGIVPLVGVAMLIVLLVAFVGSLEDSASVLLAFFRSILGPGSMRCEAAIWVDSMGSIMQSIEDTRSDMAYMGTLYEL
jgi:hypothetical protein